MTRYAEAAIDYVYDRWHVMLSGGDRGRLAASYVGAMRAMSSILVILQDKTEVGLKDKADNRSLAHGQKLTCTYPRHKLRQNHVLLAARGAEEPIADARVDWAWVGIEGLVAALGEPVS